MTTDANFVITGSDDRTVRIWDMRSCTTVAVLERHTEAIRDVEMVMEHGFLVTVAADGLVLVWDYVEQTVLQSHSHDAETLRCAVCLGDQIVVGSDEGSLVLFPLLAPSAWRKLRESRPDMKGPAVFQRWKIPSGQLLRDAATHVAAVAPGRRIQLDDASDEDDEDEEDEDRLAAKRAALLELQIDAEESEVQSDSRCQLWVLLSLSSELVAVAKIFLVDPQTCYLVGVFPTAGYRDQLVVMTAPLIKLLGQQGIIAFIADVDVQVAEEYQQLGFSEWKFTPLPDVPAAPREQRHGQVRLRCVPRKGADHDDTS
mmetsp:Transcript_42290/g.91929  ORF Transcript_42290/g.91929 Transcript_42290/m.91929 type:complete len:314 (-) Transcript_42290:343-1284(-)